MVVPVDGWTEGRFNAFITSTLRSGMRRFPNKWIALKNAYVGKQRGKSGREAAHYKCAACSLCFSSTNVEVDHIHPVVDISSGFVSWDEYVTRLFCPVENLQVLCSGCHKEKTKNERSARLHKMPTDKTTDRNVSGQTKTRRTKQLVQGLSESVESNVGKKQPRKSTTTTRTKTTKTVRKSKKLSSKT